MLAERLGGTVTTLHVPMILSSAHIAAAMRQEPQIATALALGGGADVALEGVGATEGDRLSPVFDAYVTPRMVKEIRRRARSPPYAGTSSTRRAGPYVRSCPTASSRWSSIA